MVTFGGLRGQSHLGEGVAEDARRWRLEAAMTFLLQMGLDAATTMQLERGGGLPPPFYSIIAYFSKF